MIKELVLIPISLSQNNVSDLFKSDYFKENLLSCEVFWVENIRTARRFISACKTGRNIEEIEFELLDKKTSLEQIKQFFDKYEGKKVGVMSESGCPGIADPGSKAVAFAHEKKVKVTPLIGPSSVLLALMGSGMSGQSFSFHGYLPIDKSKRRRSILELEKLSMQNHQTQIFIETPYRNNQMFAEIISSCHPDSLLCIGADLTGPNEILLTKKVVEWRKETLNLHKIPVIFLIYAGKH